MKVWLRTFDCGDYYCDGDHLAAVFATQELAESWPVPKTVDDITVWEIGQPFSIEVIGA